MFSCRLSAAFISPMESGRLFHGKSFTTMNNLLEIKGLRASIGDKEILKGIDMTILPGEVHAVMGPNGAGKSTLSAVLTGKPDYTVTSGSVFLKGKIFFR
jgi:Fe-S cluster assembly ATPase SufC